MQVPLLDVGGQIEIERLALADIGRAVGGEIDHPALVDLECSAEHGLLLLGEDVEMRDRAFVRDDRLPYLGGVGALAGKKLCKVRVAYRERARQRLMRIDVGWDRLDAGRGATADDADRGGRRERELMTERCHHAAPHCGPARPAPMAQRA